MNRELLMLVDAISHEKSVERDVVYAAVELALASATKKLYPEEAEIRVSIDKDTGETESFRRWLVVPDEAGLQNPDAEEIYSDAAEIDPDVQVGDYIEEAIESVPFGRIGAMAAKQVILQKIRDAEREMLLADFLSRGDKIFVGSVKEGTRGKMLTKEHFLSGPNVIGATGGSGTRVVARLVRQAGMFIGTNLNKADDPVAIGDFWAVVAAADIAQQPPFPRRQVLRSR